MTKPWLEKWHVNPGETDCVEVPMDPDGINQDRFVVGSVPRACLAAAAPDLARDAILTEWSGVEDFVGDGGYECCPRCRGIAPHHAENRDAIADVKDGHNVVGHKPACPRDAVLSLLGLKTYEDRDAARGALAECGATCTVYVGRCFRPEAMVLRCELRVGHEDAVHTATLPKEAHESVGKLFHFTADERVK